MMSNVERAKKMYLDQGMRSSEIAAILGLAPSTIRKMKSKGNWDAEMTPEQEAKRPPPLVNYRAPFPKSNKLGLKHGLFVRYLPQETLDIFDDIANRGVIDVLWDQIRLAYAAILRSQQLMYVKDREDKTSELISSSSGDDGQSSETYLIQLPWDKQASFMNAQAKAQNSLVRLIERYDEYCRQDLATQEQIARIEHIKATTSKLLNTPDMDVANATVIAIADLLNSPVEDRNLGQLMVEVQSGPEDANDDAE